jgi:hypothetical protein
LVSEHRPGIDNKQKDNKNGNDFLELGRNYFKKLLEKIDRINGQGKS